MIVLAWLAADRDDVPEDDCASVRVGFRDVAHAVAASDLPDDEVGAAMDRVVWRVRAS